MAVMLSGLRPNQLRNLTAIPYDEEDVELVPLLRTARVNDRLLVRLDDLLNILEALNVGRSSRG
jgi:hypothetical protein